MTPLSKAGRRYVRQTAVILAAYVVLVVALVATSQAIRASTVWLSYIAAAVVATPVLAAVYATHRYFVAEDEPVQRAIQIEALLWAIGVTFCVATSWGFLESLVGAPHVPSYCAFAVFSIVVGAVQLARRLFPRR